VAGTHHRRRCAYTRAVGGGDHARSSGPETATIGIGDRMQIMHSSPS
jgi:hypothetical protein